MVNMSSLEKNLNKIRLFIFIFQISLSIDFIFCGNCKRVFDLTNRNCYNDVIIFNDSNWRAGHAATNKKNVTIVEFSLNNGESKSRIFYGLRDDGRYYFTNSYKKVDDMTCQDCDSDTYKGRFEARNLFVSLKNDETKSKQYLFSMSSYKSLVELIDIDDGDNLNYYAWDTLKFFSLNRPIFSLEYSLFEIGDTNTFIVAFIESAGYYKVDGKDEEFSNTTTILKFHLNNFASSDYREVDKKIPFNDSYNGRCVSAWRFDISQKIVLLYVRHRGTNQGKYIAVFYDDSLNKLGEHSIFDTVENLWVGFGIFVKGISIKNDYAAFAFYHDGNNPNSLTLKIVKYLDNTYFDYKYESKFDSYSFNQDVDSNGLYKLEDNRIVLFATNKDSYTKLHMFLFDFYNNYAGYKIREYIFNYPGKRFSKEIASYMYNGYVLLCATLN